MHHRSHRLTRHLRGLLVALSAVALSAGVVLAARPATAPPAAAGSGLTRAAAAAGKTVPVVVEAPTTPDEDASGDQDPSTDQAGAGDDSTDQGDATAASQPQNHGWYVSQAAKADTPAGFANHGAYVSSIARSDQGKAAAPTAATVGKAKAVANKAAAKSHKPAHAGGH